MRENDYTGSPIDDDDPAFLSADADLYEFDADEEPFVDEFGDLDVVEQAIDFSEVAEGAKTLREAAEMLYDFADELLELAATGLELIDVIRNGQGIAVQLSDDAND